MPMWKRDKPASESPPASGDPAPLGPDFEDRVDAILGDVRQEADRILDDARRRAESATTDDEALAYRRRRLLELYDTLIARTEAVLARLDDVEYGHDSLGRMVRAVSQAADELTQEVRTAAADELTAEQDDERRQAIRMAAAGATRGEVEAQLRALSGQPEAPANVLDDVFGPSSAEDSRVPWAYEPRPE